MQKLAAVPASRPPAICGNWSTTPAFARTRQRLGCRHTVTAMADQPQQGAVQDSWDAEPTPTTSFVPRIDAPAFVPRASAPVFVPSWAAAAPPPPPPPKAQPAPPPAAEPEQDEQEAEQPQRFSPPGEASRDANGSAAAEADAIAHKTEELSITPEPAQAAPAPAAAAAEPPDEEVTVDEAKVLEAYKKLQEEDPRDHLNVVFIGHVDAGKSTLGGQILFLTGGVDKRTIEKYEREAKDKNRESWYMAYIMDTNEEERVKGITVEVGRAKFETDKRRYTILDAPGHKSFVPNMIMGAAQADVAVLVISSRKGEYETGFEKGGQTREHAQLAKTLGVVKLVVVVNKLDDHSVALPGGKWDKGRFDEIEKGLTPFLKGCGYNPKKDLQFIPISALYGHNVRDRAPADACDWYSGPTLFEALDAVEVQEKPPLAPFRMPIMDRYRDMGIMVMGKSEAGLVRVGDTLMLMPPKIRVKVDGLFKDEQESQAAKAGENLRLRISGCDETDITPGFVLCSLGKQLVPVVTQFEAKLMVVELLEHNPIFTVGYRSVLHVHTAVEECEVVKLISATDPKTKEEKKVKYVKAGAMCVCRFQVEKPICLEVFSELAALGRFTLRDEGKTIAIGKVTKLPKTR